MQLLSARSTKCPCVLCGKVSNKKLCICKSRFSPAKRCIRRLHNANGISLQHARVCNLKLRSDILYGRQTALFDKGQHAQARSCQNLHHRRYLKPGNEQPCACCLTHCLLHAAHLVCKALYSRAMHFRKATSGRCYLNELARASMAM